MCICKAQQTPLSGGEGKFNPVASSRDFPKMFPNVPASFFRCSLSVFQVIFAVRLGGPCIVFKESLQRAPLIRSTQ